MKTATGLHLWAVFISDSSNYLWVTTRTRSFAQAERKARKVVKRDGYVGKIERIENKGRIDA